MQRAPLKHWWQKVLHSLAIVGGWALFCYWWYVVVYGTWTTDELKLLIFGSLIVAPALTLYWVLHNIALFRIKGQRRTVREVPHVYHRDWNGAAVLADWPALRRARYVTVDLVDAGKTYTPASLGQLPAVLPTESADGVVRIHPDRRSAHDVV